MKNKKSKEAKVREPVREGKVIMTELVLPSHTNALGNIFGGVVMSWIDVAGAIAAQRHSKSQVVTVSVDYLHFIVPIKLGFVVKISAEVTYVGRTSMEVEILVDAENVITSEFRRATKAYLTYVAVDEFGRPRPSPALVLKTPEQKKQFKEAKKRRAFRLEKAKLM